MKRIILILFLLMLPSLEGQIISGRERLQELWLKNPIGGRTWVFREDSVLADSLGSLDTAVHDVAGQYTCFPVRKRRSISPIGFGAFSFRKTSTDPDSSQIAIAIHSKNFWGDFSESFNRHSHTDYTIDTLITTNNDTGTVEIPFRWTVLSDSLCVELRNSDLTVQGNPDDSVQLNDFRVVIE